METTVVAFHRGGLARYLVRFEGDGQYEASLLRYDGKPLFAPPLRLTFTGNSLSGDEPHAALVEELFRVAQKRIPVQQPAPYKIERSR